MEVTYNCSVVWGQASLNPSSLVPGTWPSLLQQPFSCFLAQANPSTEWENLSQSQTKPSCDQQYQTPSTGNHLLNTKAVWLFLFLLYSQTFRLGLPTESTYKKTPCARSIFPCATSPGVPTERLQHLRRYQLSFHMTKRSRSAASDTAGDDYGFKIYGVWAGTSLAAGFPPAKQQNIKSCAAHSTVKLTDGRKTSENPVQ